jgi:hypothetical protein
MDPSLLSSAEFEEEAKQDDYYYRESHSGRIIPRFGFPGLASGLFLFRKLSGHLSQ